MSPYQNCLRTSEDTGLDINDCMVLTLKKY